MAFRALSRPVFVQAAAWPAPAMRAAPIASPALVDARGYATLKEIQLRLKSVKNIAKITKSMKMIASTKLTRAQKAMDVARTYGMSSRSIYPTEGKSPENAKKLVVAVSSDRGLCGAIHSSVAKYTKRVVRADPSTQVIVLGDKARNQIAREAKGNIVFTFNQIGRSAPTYREASGIATTILNSNLEFDTLQILYNSFKSVLAYETVPLEIYKEDQLTDAENFDVYEQEDDDILANLTEFNFTNSLFWAMSEAHASEMSSRRTAMENATKNAGEMINKLTMSYNRSRQANITNELCDIITGASAL